MVKSYSFVLYTTHSHKIVVFTLLINRSIVCHMCVLQFMMPESIEQCSAIKFFFKNEIKPDNALKML